jgi:hypothetical protein
MTNWSKNKRVLDEQAAARVQADMDAVRISQSEHLVNTGAAIVGHAVHDQLPNLDRVIEQLERRALAEGYEKFTPRGSLGMLDDLRALRSALQDIVREATTP